MTYRLRIVRASGIGFRAAFGWSKCLNSVSGLQRIELSRSRNVDLIKDAVASMLMAAGAPDKLVVGECAAHWMAGAVCAGKSRRERDVRLARDIIVSTTNESLANYLIRSKPNDLQKVQPATGEALDMTGGSVIADLDPVIPGMTTFLDARCLTPVCISRKGDRSGGKWHDSVLDVDLSATVNARLSRLTGRPVNLSVIPDDEYVSSRSRHSVRSRRQGNAEGWSLAGRHRGGAVISFHPLRVGG